MKNRKNIFIILIAAFLLLATGAAVFGQTTEEFQKRRQAVLEKMEPNSVFIIRSNAPAGEFEQYRQENNFFYLTGLNEPNSALIMRASGSGRGGRGGPAETLFMNQRSASRADWDPQSLGFEGARETLGFQNISPISEFQSRFESVMLSGISVLYMNYERSRGLHSPLTPDEDLFKKARDKGASFEIGSTNSLIGPLRVIKSPAEIEYLKTAIDITAEAHKEAMRSLKAGMIENQLQAIIEYVFSINGAKRVGFNSIIGSGPNSVVLHWSDNSRTMKDGDLVVVDIGAEYNMYTADVTRTLPVSGKFNERQKEVYNIVLNAQQAAMEALKPGGSWRDVTSAANAELVEGLQKMGLIKDQSELRNYYFHGLGHYIGLHVHENGTGRLGVLEPGMVLTIEPGIYIRDEGLGVRIEDDFLITESGYVHLSKNAPRTVEDIESLMKENGLDYSRYLIKK